MLNFFSLLYYKLIDFIINNWLEYINILKKDFKKIGFGVILLFFI